MYLLMLKKAVCSPAAKGQANVGPTTPAGPVYEEVSPKEEIELNTNQAWTSRIVKLLLMCMLVNNFNNYKQQHLFIKSHYIFCTKKEAILNEWCKLRCANASRHV